MQVVQLITPQMFGDERGFFFESWNKSHFDEAVGAPITFSQDNHSQGLLEVCLNSPGWVAAPTLYCEGTAPDPWPPIPPPRLLMQEI